MCEGLLDAALVAPADDQRADDDGTGDGEEQEKRREECKAVSDPSRSHVSVWDMRVMQKEGK